MHECIDRYTLHSKHYALWGVHECIEHIAFLNNMYA